MSFVVEDFPKSNYVWMVHPVDTIKWTNISNLTAQRTANRVTDGKTTCVRIVKIFFWLTDRALDIVTRQTRTVYH